VLSIVTVVGCFLWCSRCRYGSCWLFTVFSFFERSDLFDSVLVLWYDVIVDLFVVLGCLCVCAVGITVDDGDIYIHY
jgi:hypothetical protein